MQPRDFLNLSRQLAQLHRGRPSQVALRRALSTAYYAMFHMLAKCGADLLIGGSGASRSAEAWRQVYRALEHGTAKTACRRADINRFPQSIEDFANQFVTMQEKRHKADYDPHERFYKSSVIQDVNAADQAMKSFGEADVKDRRAFAAFVLFKTRSV